MEIRIIGTTEELERAEKIISDIYEIQHQSGLYSCKGSAEQHRQYYKVTEKGADDHENT